MTKFQNNRLKMYKVVLSVCSGYTEVTAKIPTFVKAVTDLLQLVNEIERLQVLQSADNKGVTLDNQALYKRLTGVALAVSGALYVHASENKNQTLKSKVNFKNSDFSRFSQTERIASCTTILEEAKTLATALADFGVTASQLAEFESLLSEYKNVYTKPREMVVSRSTTTEAMNSAFSKAGLLLKDQCDRLARQFKISNPEFYQAYTLARIIEDRGIRHTPEPETETTEQKTETPAKTN